MGLNTFKFHSLDNSGHFEFDTDHPVEGLTRTLSLSLAIIEFEGYFGCFSGIIPIIFSKDVYYDSSQ